jgi:Putative auto-transporter adhesin, head GIN domain
MKKFFIVVFSFLILFSSCRYVTGERIRGNGYLKTEERSPGNFKSVASHGSFNVYISSGDQSVKIEAEENLLPYIETYVEGSTLHVGTKDNYWLRPGREVKIFVSSPDFESIRSYGSGDITGQSKITNSSNLELKVNGSANIKMDVDAPEINTETNGSGDIDLKGTTKSFTGEIHGSGNIRAMDLQSDDATIRIYGSGNADVFANSKLDVHVAGSGDVHYKGNAQISSSIAGSGRVRKVD